MNLIEIWHYHRPALAKVYLDTLNVVFAYYKNLRQKKFHLTTLFGYNFNLIYATAPSEADEQNFLLTSALLD